MSQSRVPGTVHLVDLEGTLHVHHSSGERDVILIPQPTQDPNDPLNWSPGRRWRSTVMQMIWTFFTSFIINGLPPAYLAIEKETGISIGDLNTGNGLMYLFFGVGTLIVQPLALNYGRRPVAFWSAFITTFLVLWASFMQSAAEWYANRILIGFALASIECLIELCVVDTKFLHERGFHMSFYTWVLFGGAIVVPIPAGFLADAAGWRWINRMLAIIGFIIAIATFLFFEETMFYRSSTDSTSSLDNSSGQKTNIDGEEFRCNHESDEKIARTGYSATDKSSPEQPSSNSDSETGQVRDVSSFVSRLKLWSLRDPRQPNTFWKRLHLPIVLLRFPSLLFSGLLVGSALAWFNFLMGSIPTTFGNPPYNFSSATTGLTYIACVLGMTAGCLITGPANDRLALWLARRNNGIKEPEARLWAAVVLIILQPAGYILYGAGAAHGIHWIGVCFGQAIAFATIVAEATLAFSYAVDCYKEAASELIVSIVLIRNIMGFAFAYAVTPMINNLGLQNAFILIACLAVLLTSLCFVMIHFGKAMRTATAASYWGLIEKYGMHAH